MCKIIYAKLSIVHTCFVRVYMEAVKLETVLPGLSNLEIAQETLGTVTVVTSCGSHHLLVNLANCNHTVVTTHASLVMLKQIQERSTDDQQK